jgi:hypothetical protein
MTSIKIEDSAYMDIEEIKMPKAIISVKTTHLANKFTLF